MTPPEPQVIIAAELRMPESVAQLVSSAVPSEEPQSVKVASVALGLLHDLAEGGMMIPAAVVGKLVDSFGGPVQLADIQDQFERGLNRKDGQLSINITVDPAYEGCLEEVAKFQGVTVKEVIQNAWHTGWDNGWFYDAQPPLQRILMTQADYLALKEALDGKDFTSGTELAKLIQEQAEASFLPGG